MDLTGHLEAESALPLSSLTPSCYPIATQFQCPLNSFERECSQTRPARCIFFLSYKLLQQGNLSSPLPFLAQWERDLGCVFTQREMSRFFILCTKSSICNNYLEFRYKDFLVMCPPPFGDVATAMDTFSIFYGHV